MGAKSPAADDQPFPFARAWVALTAALALHVADEAATGFLDVYNPAVESIRAYAPWLPLPTFTFWPWLVGLAAGIALMACLIPRVRRGSPGLVTAAIPLSGLMVANALGHIGGSLYMRRPMPGLVSSPFLLVAAAFTMVSAVGLHRRASRS